MIITSKYSGRCTTCSGPIVAGDRVAWTKGVKGVKHAACTDEGRAVAESVERSRATDAAVSAPAPEGLAYLPYQRAGIAYALGRTGTLIADEMGLGKTIQAIGLINADESIRRVLVICPASLKLNWARELRRWLVRSPTITIVNGKTSVVSTGGDLDIRIANYDVLKKHTDSLAREWDLVVVDEAHYIKNGKAQRTKLVHQIAKGAKRRLLLTGTPIANRPIELWSLLQVVAPEAWDPAGQRKGKPVAAGSGAGFFRFARRYADAHQGAHGWDFSGASNLPELQERLRATCMIRRLKSEVLTELPAKRRQIIELPGGEDAVDEERRAWARHEDSLERLRVEVELSRASDDPEDYAQAVQRLNAGTRLAFTEIALARHQTALAKADQVIEHVREALESGTQKLVLFAHHKDLIAKLRDGLAEYNSALLTGDTSMTDRQGAVDRFQTDSSCRLFIGSITAAGVGLTLTASSHVVFAELDWVPGNVSQAEDRTHRIGQTSSVLVQHLVLEGSLDARMARILVEKQEIADRALDRKVEHEPALPVAERAATEARRAELDAAAEALTSEQVAAIHEALRRLAGMCDGAQLLDGSGFSRIDVRIGHELAARSRLTPRQGALGQRLCRKYKRQIGDELLRACGV